MSEQLTVPSHLPPGPPLPRLLQTGLVLGARIPAERFLRGRYGDTFTMRVAGMGNLVVVSDPELMKEVFRADPEVLHAGDHSPLRAILGDHSLLATDEGNHLRQRKLLLPPFHGRRMQGYEAIIAEETRRELDTWPADREFETLEPMMRITLNAILRAVFGAEGAQLRELQALLPRLVTLGSRMALLGFLHHDLGRWSPWGRFLRLRAEFDDLIERLVATHRADPRLAERGDVLSLLLQATHEDGTPVTQAEIADQLLTVLAAGHETTAGQLAWTVERLRRHPAVLERLVAEADAGGRAFRDATIQEMQRCRPVIAGAGRYCMAPFRLGRWTLPRGTYLVCSATLAQSDPRLFADPERFDPGRFLDRKPPTYEWVPFGGGVRRCIGASFAHMEMDVVLRTLLETFELRPTDAPDERWRSRGVAFVPRRGGRAVVRRRRRAAGGKDAVRASRDVAAPTLA